MKHPAIPRTTLPEGKSKNVVSHGYDSATRTLAVEFKGGGIYHYANVSPEQYADLQAADSFGSFLHAHMIRSGKHPATHTNPKPKKD